ncbi:hypothetical protein Val02_90810 [Virgisporangium aliadipatigenens]|uniref:Cyclic nucleotide-binding domain-containing protein n=1 Tax=Virgisporangium aliadipatigenens TaxID=741659 RepID=A0A8J4DVA5_9ACTN|nr:cyclic nucleotide-binding domain-containing protein [Virgisporangium aliadipatigenens]GIJ52195.1 hypothetical protein Val02_90810 [Virgisporangium aliadipatigenens]
MSDIGTPMRCERPARRSFLGSLSPEARRDLLASGREEHYPAGAYLCHQDDPTSDVMVIISGRVRVRMRIGGRLQFVAVRGPGDLIGERTALVGHTRSASVVTVERVIALVVPPGAFAALIERHPSMLWTLRRAERERRIEDAHGTPEGDGAAAVVPMGPRPPAFPERPASQPLNCTIVLTDIAGFGDPRRNDGDRTLIREALAQMLQESFTEAGVPWHECHHEGRGDGILTVVPPQHSTAAVLHPMMGMLAVLLHSHNRRAGPPVYIRLRMAVHVGPIAVDRQGLTGTAIVYTARLAEAARMKERMLATEADLGVMASDYVFDNFVRHSPHLVAEEFERVRIREKESRMIGWMCLTGTRPARRPGWEGVG